MVSGPKGSVCMCVCVCVGGWFLCENGAQERKDTRTLHILFVLSKCAVGLHYIRLHVFILLCHAESLSRVWLFATPWTVACQALLSMGFSRQEYWSELPCPPTGDLPDSGIEPGSSPLQVDCLLSEPAGKPSFSWGLIQQAHVPGSDSRSVLVLSAVWPHHPSTPSLEGRGSMEVVAWSTVPPSTSPNPPTPPPNPPWVGHQWATQAHAVSLGESGLLRRRAPWSWWEA